MWIPTCQELPLITSEVLRGTLRAVLAQLSKLNHIPVMFNKACGQNESLSWGCISPHTQPDTLETTPPQDCAAPAAKKAYMLPELSFSPKSWLSCIFLMTTQCLTPGEHQE